jgi:predicted metal-dependent hydrolase
MIETPAAAVLPGGPLAYTLRRHPRSRRLRVTIDPRRGVVVSVPPAARRGWAQPGRLVEDFLSEREPWIRRHLASIARQRAEHAARGGLADGALVRFRGTLHRLRIDDAGPGAVRTTVARVGADDGDELVIRLARRDRRPVGRVLRDWLVERARAAVDDAIAVHATPLGAVPASMAIRDPRSRWGSASRKGRLMLSWRLILAPPDALETVVVHELAHLRVFGHGPRFWSLVAGRRPDHAHWRRWLREHSAELHAALDETA